jgi:transposase
MLSESEDLDLAWQLKELFVSFRKSKNAKEGRIELNRWLEVAKEAKLSDFAEAITALTNWKEEILNSLDYPYTNGFTEGCNNRIKVIKRNAFGLRNFNRFRNRIIHCCA